MHKELKEKELKRFRRKDSYGEISVGMAAAKFRVERGMSIRQGISVLQQHSS